MSRNLHSSSPLIRWTPPPPKNTFRLNLIDAAGYDLSNNGAIPVAQGIHRPDSRFRAAHAFAFHRPLAEG